MGLQPWLTAMHELALLPEPGLLFQNPALLYSPKASEFQPSFLQIPSPQEGHS